MAQSVKFQLRRDTAANWAANNPVLAPGEPAFSVFDGTATGNRLKIGSNGQTGWNSLPYVDCGTTGATGALGQGSWTPVISDPTQIVQSTTVPGTFTKIGPSAAGPYISSVQSYTSGCYASLTVGTTGETCLGLSTAGSTGSAITSYEIAIILDSIPTTPPTLRTMLRANGAYLGSTAGFGTFASGDNFAIQYDGTLIKFYKNGVQIGPTVTRVPTGSLYLFALQIQQGNIIQNVLLLPLAPGPPGTGGGGTGVAQSSWDPVAVPPTNVRIGPTGGSFTKINGLVAGYDTAIRSAQAYLSGCYVSFTTPSATSGNTPGGGVTGTEATFGISSIPNPIGNTGVAVTDIQYGINYNASGTTYRFYESADLGPGPSGGACLPGDSFSIIYNGTNVNYYHQNSLVRSVARAAGQTGAFHLEGNFQNYGTINNLVFGPIGQQTISTGDVLTTPGPTGNYGPVFYNRTSTQFLTGGPWFWSYRLTAPLTGLNPGNGTGSDGIALGYPAGSFIGPWTIAPPATGFDAYVQEPNGLSMIQNDASNPYTFFYAKISGVYLISFTCFAGGGNSTISFVGNGIVYSYAIGTVPGGNCTTFMAPLTAGVGYLFIAGGQGAGGGPFSLYTGTQAQFYLLCPT